MEFNITGIEKDAPLPLYYQLKAIIKNQIEEGKLKPDELIPSERDLMELYNISRTPVRQAINELVVEGLLRREHGKGTFVAGKKISQSFLENLSSFGEEMSQKGLSYRTKVLEQIVLQGNSNLEKIFGAETREFYRLERLRYIKDTPYVLLTTYIPCSIAPGLFDTDFEQHSLYKTLSERYGVEIKYADRDIEAVTVSEEDASLLDISHTSAIQLTRTVAYLSDGKPFEYSIARYRGDLSKFTVRVNYKKI